MRASAVRARAVVSVHPSILKKEAILYYVSVQAIVIIKNKPFCITYLCTPPGRDGVQTVGVTHTSRSGPCAASAGDAHLPVGEFAQKMGVDVAKQNDFGYVTMHADFLKQPFLN